MLVSFFRNISLKSDDLPLHLSKIKLENVIVTVLSIATGDIHILFVHNWGVICHFRWSMWTFSNSFYEFPAEVCLPLFTNCIQIWDIIHVELIHRVHGPLTNVKTSIDKNSALEHKSRMITSSFWSHLCCSEFIPVVASFLLHVLLNVARRLVVCLGGVQWLPEILVLLHLSSNILFSMLMSEFCVALCCVVNFWTKNLNYWNQQF